MVEDVNLSKRLRIPVRGRVLVFTTSLYVEYVNKQMTQSFPLYSGAIPYGFGFGLSFCVELDGFLTFDEASHNRIVELSPYKQFYYDPRASAVVSFAPIVFVPRIQSWRVASGSYNSPNGLVTVYHPAVTVEITKGVTEIWFVDYDEFTVAAANAIGVANFPVGSVWLGQYGYAVRLYK